MTTDIDRVAWLEDFLSAGPRWSRDVNQAANEAGITKGQLRWARRDLEVIPQKCVTTLDGRRVEEWFMALPQHGNDRPEGSAKPGTSPCRSPARRGC